MQVWGGVHWGGKGETETEESQALTASESGCRRRCFWKQTIFVYLSGFPFSVLHFCYLQVPGHFWYVYKAGKLSRLPCDIINYHLIHFWGEKKKSVDKTSQLKECSLECLQWQWSDTLCKCWMLEGHNLRAKSHWSYWFPCMIKMALSSLWHRVFFLLLSLVLFLLLSLVLFKDSDFQKNTCMRSCYPSLTFYLIWMC